MNASEQVFGALGSLKAALPELEQSLGTERWVSFRIDLLALLLELERCRTEPEWQALQTKLQVFGSHYPGVRRLLDADDGTRSALRGDGYRGTPRGLDQAPDRGSVSDLLARFRRVLAPPRPLPIETYPEARVPEEVDERTTFLLEVTARAKPTALAQEALHLPRKKDGPVDLEVEVVLPADGSLRADGQLVSPLRVPEGQDSVTLTFPLFARDRGRHPIEVSFRREGVECFVLRPAVLVRSAEQALASPSIATPVSVTGVLRAAPGELDGLVLHLEQRGADNDRRFFRATLRGAPRLLPAPLEGTIELPVEIKRLLVKLCQDLNDQLDPLDEETAELRLENLGAELAERLLPSTLRQALSHARVPEGTALHVESDDPWAPWELLRLNRAGGGGSFLGERFALTRWLRHESLRYSLPRGRAILVVPASSGLQVNDERRALRDLVGRAPEELLTLAEVMPRLRGAEGCGLLHFACHGLAEPSDPMDGQLALDGGALRAVDVPKVDAELGTGPLAGACVFLNACEAGIPGRGLSGHGGWAKAFLGAGAGAFVAPSWSVGDRSASVFARGFYGALGTGATVGEAGRLARLAARVAGNPDRLGYAVYAAPGARLEGR